MKIYKQLKLLHSMSHPYLSGERSFLPKYLCFGVADVVVLVRLPCDLTSYPPLHFALSLWYKLKKSGQYPNLKKFISNDTARLTFWPSSWNFRFQNTCCMIGNIKSVACLLHMCSNSCVSGNLLWMHTAKIVSGFGKISEKVSANVEGVLTVVYIPNTRFLQECVYY